MESQIYDRFWKNNGTIKIKIKFKDIFYNLERVQP